MLGSGKSGRRFRIRIHRSSGRSAPPIANFGDRGATKCGGTRVLWAGLILLRISAASERVAQSHFVQCLFGYAPFDVRACRMPLVYPHSGRIKRVARPPRRSLLGGKFTCLASPHACGSMATPKFYASLFHNSHVDAVHRAPSDYPSGKAGDVLLVEFTLMGQPFSGLNGGPQFKFNEAISFQIPVETQAEADRFADALSAVPEAEQCGWVKDRFGVSWQIVPRQLIRLIGDLDRARAKRAFDAMMQMTRIDIAAIERAADGIGLST